MSTPSGIVRSSRNRVRVLLARSLAAALGSGASRSRCIACSAAANPRGETVELVHEPKGTAAPGRGPHA